MFLSLNSGTNIKKYVFEKVFNDLMAPQKAAKSSKVNLQFKGITNGSMT